MGLQILKAIRWISSTVPGFKGLDGYKTYFGVALLTITYAFLYLVGLQQLLPHLTWIPAASENIKSVLDVATTIAEGLGWTFTVVGVADKKAKKIPEVVNAVKK